MARRGRAAAPATGAVPTATAPVVTALGGAPFPVGLGTAAFGWTIGDADAAAVLDAFVGAGGNVIETRDADASGRAQTILGRWLAGGGARDRVVLAAHVGDAPEAAGLGAVSVVRAVEASLQRLRTDRVDLLWLRDDGVSPLDDVLSTAQWLMQAGKVARVGLVDPSPARLVEARVLAGAGLPLVESVQVRHHLLGRQAMRGDLGLVARGQGIRVSASGVLAGGFLAGRVRTRQDALGSLRGQEAGRFLDRRGLRVLRALDRVAADHGVSTAVAAVAWALQVPGIQAVVVGASRPSQIAEAAVAARVTLSSRAVEALDAASGAPSPRERLP